MIRHSFSIHGVCFALALLGTAASVRASAPADTPKPGEPTDAKARKTYAEGLEYLKREQKALALDDFRKANKQDGDHCMACLSRSYSLAMELWDFKAAEDVVRDALAVAKGDAAKATLHFQMAVALQRQGVVAKKDSYFTQSCDEFRTALELDPSFTMVHYGLGVSLARLHKDDEARAEFKTFLAQDKDALNVHPRAARFAERVELARAKMAPPFSLTTIDGRRVSMDDLTGKVVLIDFWATWCGPCREALPHVRKIAQEFNGQPLVVLSISLDTDEAKWKDFVAKNGMTWLQYRDGYFDGSMAKMFTVTAIPATFSIDADGVLEDQHVGDANIEGKLKKMVAQAAEMANQKANATNVKTQGAGD